MTQFVEEKIGPYLIKFKYHENAVEFEGFLTTEDNLFVGFEGALHDNIKYVEPWFSVYVSCGSCLNVRLGEEQNKTHFCEFKDLKELFDVLTTATEKALTYVKEKNP